MRHGAAILLGATIFVGPLVPGQAAAQPPPDQLQRGTAQEKPLDRGPFTPRASEAFHGGGVVLQGPPGAPPPPPRALPEPPPGGPPGAPPHAPPRPPPG